MNNTQATQASPSAKPNGVAAGQQHQPSYEELKAQLAAAKAELAAKPKAGKLTVKVSEKGGISVYGLGRFPTTLYAEQWERLLAPEQVAEVLDVCKNGKGGVMPTRKNAD